MADTSQPIARRPSDRAYACIQWIFMGLLAALWALGRYGPRYLDIPRPVGFRLFVVAILAMNILWWSVADRRFARHINSPTRSRRLRILVAVFSAVLVAPLIQMVIVGRFPAFLNTAPVWYSAAVTLWNIGLMVVMPMIAGLRLLFLGIAALARRIKRTPQSQPTVEPINLSRRAMLRTSLASIPMLALSAGTGYSYAQNRRLQVSRHQLPAPWLPARLKGLTITHVSDLHVGRLYRPDQLPRLVDMVNDLRSDLILITGDVVDISNDMLPPALDAFAQMHAAHGLFTCIGNHDEIDDRDAFITAMRERLPLLIDQCHPLTIGGERITLAGLDWARNDRAIGPRAGHAEHVQSMLRLHDPNADGPIIALAHHPHAWDALADAGIPLTLSGHTHGGQIMLTPPNTRPDIGCGQALFRYIRGFYEKPGSTLFVNRGVGNWFPLRINSPAEIVQIQLV
ncbi:MAG: metallophosphoesterase [Planctomycetota bacterium]